MKIPSKSPLMAVKCTRMTQESNNEIKKLYLCRLHHLQRFCELDICPLTKSYKIDSIYHIALSTVLNTNSMLGLLCCPPYYLPLTSINVFSMQIFVPSILATNRTILVVKLSVTKPSVFVQQLFHHTEPRVCDRRQTV